MGKKMTRPNLSKFGADVESQGFVSPARAAKHVGRSVSLVRRWMDTGEFPVYELLGTKMIKASEYLTFIKNNAKLVEVNDEKPTTK